MIHVLENEFLTVKVEDFGAELVGIFDKEKERQVIWQAEPAYWKRHAPILFPNVGKHFGNHFRVNGSEYASKQHGFARDMEFACIRESTDSVTHRLEATASTKEAYPFDFTLEVCHTLKERRLTVSWRVTNPGSETMYFTIGGHPAFNVPVLPDTRQSDYHLTFDGQDSLTYLALDLATGTAKPEDTHILPLENGSCLIDEHMFDKDALVFDNQITKAGIALPDGTPYVELCCDGFPNFGIWAAPGAPFVCLEPWMGRCDNYGFEGELSQKPFINTLKPDQVFNASYTIEVF